MKEMLGRDCPQTFPLADVFGSGNDAWIDGKVFYRKVSLIKGETLVWVVVGEIFSIFGVYPQKTLKIYREYSHHAGNSASRAFHPLYEEVEEINSPTLDHTKAVHLDTSEPTVSMDLSTKSLHMTSTQYVASLKKRQQENKRRKGTVFSSLFESKIISGLPDFSRTESQGDLWSEVLSLVKKRRVVLGNVVKWMDLTLLVTLALALIVLLSLYFTTENSANDSARMEEFANFNDRRELSLLSALTVRQLSAPALFPNTTAELLSLADSLKAQISLLKDSANSDSGLRRAQYDRFSVWWEYNGDYFQQYSANALSVMTMLQTHVAAIASQTQKGVWAKSDVLSVYRNGPAESLKLLNLTMRDTITLDEQREEEKERFLPGILSVGVVGIVVLFSAASYFLLKRADSVRRDLWKIIAQLPIATYISARSSSKSRLETIHNTEFLEMDLNEFCTHSRPGNPRYLPYKLLPEFKLLTLCLALFVVSLAVGLIAMYVGSLKDSTYFNTHVPELVFFAGLREVALLKAQFFFRELTLPDSYAELCGDRLVYYDVGRELRDALEELRQLEYRLTYELDIAKTQEYLLFDSATELAESALSRGAHNALNSLIYDLETNTDGSSFLTLESRINALRPVFERLTLLYISSAVAKGESQHFRFLSALLGIALAMLLYYLLVIRTIIRYTLHRINDEWRMLLFFPKDSSAQIYKLIHWNL